MPCFALLVLWHALTPRTPWGGRALRSLRETLRGTRFGLLVLWHVLASSCLANLLSRKPTHMIKLAVVLAALLIACGGEVEEPEDPCTPHCECIDHTAGLVPLSSAACSTETWIAYRPTPATWQACVAECK